MTEGVERIDAELPQTQCTRCGFVDCRAYAVAIDARETDINRCPPGGAEGIVRLSTLTGRPARPLDAACGIESPRGVAVIDESWCIGCTLCIKACPVDCIVGASKAMHTVIESWCTGCELCLPACPVDCITMDPVSGSRTGWQAWSAGAAADARERYAWHRERGSRDRREAAERLEHRAAATLADLPAHSTHTDPLQLDRKRNLIEAALARSRARRTRQSGG